LGGVEDTLQFFKPTSKVSNIAIIKDPVDPPRFAWTRRGDHSKWGISVTADDNKKWVCVGDSNREKGQEKRGGGMLCIKNPDLWEQFNFLIAGKFTASSPSIVKMVDNTVLSSIGAITLNNLKPKEPLTNIPNTWAGENTLPPTPILETKMESVSVTLSSGKGKQKAVGTDINPRGSKRRRLSNQQNIENLNTELPQFTAQQGSSSPNFKAQRLAYLLSSKEILTLDFFLSSPNEITVESLKLLADDEIEKLKSKICADQSAECNFKDIDHKVLSLECLRLSNSDNGVLSCCDNAKWTL